MIVVNDIWKSYGKHEVLRGLSLTVKEGEMVVVLGRSGAGKSVLLRQIMGIETPEKGYVEVKGQRISELPMARRYQVIRDMGMLFQGAALFDSMNVGQNTAFYLEEHEQYPPQEIEERVAHALSIVGLKGTQHKMPSELSGGMRKRAAIARLIVYHPRIVLYDEPTAGLDPQTAEYIVQLINKTRKELNSTGIVVTHDIRTALELGDRLAFHHDGTIVQIAPTKEFLRLKDPVVKAFLEKAMVTEEFLKHYAGND